MLIKVWETLLWTIPPKPLQPQILESRQQQKWKRLSRDTVSEAPSPTSLLVFGLDLYTTVLQTVPWSVVCCKLSENILF